MKKILSIITLVLLVLIIFLPKFLIKVNVVCKEHSQNCPTSILEKLEKVNGKSIYLAKKEIEKLLNEDELISGFSIQFKLPNILKVDIVVKKSLFSLKSMLSQKYAMTSEDGTVLSYSDKFELPSVYINEDLPGLGENVGVKNKLALELIDGVYKMYQVGVGVINNDTLVVDLPGGIRVIFPLVDADRSTLLGSLRLIYSNIQKDEQGKYSEIDLRFENPVLR